MKQGSGVTTQSAHKVEPNSRAVNPGGAAQIGLAQGRMAAVESLYAGRGYEAPKAKETIHPKGSQK